MNAFKLIKQNHPIKTTPRHLLTGEELTAEEINLLILTANILKKERTKAFWQTMLKHQHLALLFDKPSLRTRCSFTVAMRELGGDVVEVLENTRKKETPTDTVKVLQGYCHAIMIRTHADSILYEMQTSAKIPIINGLSDLHHPCQILSDLFTLYEHFGSLKNLNLCYVGDGNNILHSLLLIAPLVGINIHYCCPISRGPETNILTQSKQHLGPQHGQIKSFASPITAVQNSHVVYTDVWTSMGFENKDEHLFSDFQVNETLMKHALTEAVFMHCMPMNRGFEVSETLADKPCSIIFKQSENRLHMQKALLLFLLKGYF